MKSPPSKLKKSVGKGKTLFELDALDIDKMIDECEQSNLDVSVLDRLEDEKDFASCPNVVHWVTDPQWSYLGQDPFPKQIELLAKTTEEWCPNKKCTDREFWKAVPVDVPIYEVMDRVSFLEHGVCPRCSRDKNYWLNKKDGKGSFLHGVNELVAVIGMRASKTTTAAGMLAPYMLHRYLTLPTDPSRYFGMLEGKALHMSFVAITATQAAETLWQSFKDSLDQSTWYKNYFDYLNSKGKEIGKELLQYKSTFLWFPTKRLHCNYIPANMRTMRGRTRFFAAIDELGWFSNNDVDRVQANATETYEALRKSLRTVRSGFNNLLERGVVNPPNAILANIGSPYEANDKIMELLRRKNKRCVAFQFATWEFNPLIKEDDPDLVEERKDEVIFMRDFGAQPPMSSNPLISLKIKDLYGLVDQTRLPLFKSKTITIRRKDRDYLATELVDFIPEGGKARLLTVDAGEKQNAFSVACMSMDFSATSQSIVVDGLIEVKPTRDLTVNFPAILDTIIDGLIKKLNVLYVVYDRWQATHHVQKINDTEFEHIREGGPKAEKYTLSYSDFRDIRDVFYSPDSIVLPKTKYVISEEDILKGGFDTYKDDPATHLLVQLLTVRDLGNRVFKPINGDDDIFRTVALGIRYLLQEEIIEEFRKYSSKATSKRSSGPVGLYQTIKPTLVPRAATGQTGSMHTSIGTVGLVRSLANSVRRRS